MEFPNPVKSWIDKIDIPNEIVEIGSYFTQEGRLNPEKDLRLLDIERGLSNNREAIKDTLYRLIHSPKLRDYLVDSQIHFIDGGGRPYLLEGGFSAVLKGSIVGRKLILDFSYSTNPIYQLKG